jgi:hypothetical protein
MKVNILCSITLLVVGFKLSHFDNPKARKLKAIIWSESKARNYSFHSDPEESDNVKGARTYIKFEDIEDDIKKIYDFGVSQDMAEDYNDEVPEIMIYLD